MSSARSGIRGFSQLSSFVVTAHGLDSRLAELRLPLTGLRLHIAVPDLRHSNVVKKRSFACLSSHLSFSLLRR